MGLGPEVTKIATCHILVENWTGGSALKPGKFASRMDTYVVHVLDHPAIPKKFPGKYHFPPCSPSFLNPLSPLSLLESRYLLFLAPPFLFSLFLFNLLSLLLFSRRNVIHCATVTFLFYRSENRTAFYTIFLILRSTILINRLHCICNHFTLLFSFPFLFKNALTENYNLQFIQF